MEQYYISKSVLVAEIEKMVSNGKAKCQQSQENNDQVSYIAWSEHIATCGKFLSLLDTLEVKEVDLEKEIGMFTTKQLLKKRNYSTGVFHITQADINNIAKHFFEVGLQLQNIE